MKKQEFLEELKQYLHVLEDGEQEDILQEYEQHIEMKINKGLSEEEAIRDFGPVRELAGEILEAYHVKLEGREAVEEKAPKKGLKKPVLTCVFRVVHGVNFQVKRAGKGLFKGMKGLWVFMGKPFRLMGKVLSSWKENVQNWQRNRKSLAGTYEGNQDAPEDRTERSAGLMLCGEDKDFSKNGSELHHRNKNMLEEKTRKKRMKKGMVLPMLAKGIRRMCYGILSAVCWTGRLLWNCGVVCAAIFSGFIGLIFLYLFGMLLVLWKEGYPLGGVVLGCMGAVLCFLSLAVFGSTFYRKKRQH